MTTNTTPALIPAPDALTSTEAAALIGVVPSTLWRWTRAGHIPGVMVYAGRFVYDRAALEEFSATRINRSGLHKRIKKAA